MGLSKKRIRLAEWIRLSIRDGDHADVLELLPRWGASEPLIDGGTILDHVIRHGDAVLVNLLLPFYDPKEADPDGWTALMFAASLGQREVVECLLPVSDLNAKNSRGFCAARIANGDLRQMIEAFALAESERTALSSDVRDPRGSGRSGRL